MSNTPDMKALAKRICEINEANGWTIDVKSKTDIGMKVALIASELVEAIDEIEALRSARNRSASEIINATLTEFADTIIRILHLGTTLDPNYQFVLHPRTTSRMLFIPLRPNSFSADVFEGLIRPTFKLFEDVRGNKSDVYICNALNALFNDTIAAATCLEPAIDIFAVIDAKLEKNAARGFRHGGKNY